jgi:hypothetical protein
MTAGTAGARTVDRIRQVVVTVAAIFCLVGTLIGTGVLGTPVERSSGGALSDEATLVAPAGPAFSVWTVIYLGLLAYTIWQWTAPTSQAARRTGWLAAASMALNAGWLLVTQAGWVWLSVVVIIVLAAVLVRIVQVLDDPSPGLAQLMAAQVTFGGYLGWVAVATFANIAAALAANGVGPDSAAAAPLAVGAVVAATGLGLWLVLLARTPGTRFSIAAAMAWGLIWIGVGRLMEPYSVLVATLAFAAALVVLAAALLAQRSVSSGRRPSVAAG